MSAPAPQPDSAPAFPGSAEQAVPDSQELASEMEGLLFQCRLVLEEGRGFIPGGELDALNRLQSELQDLLHQEKWERARPASARLSDELQKYGLLAMLGFARALSQNDRVAARANPNLAEQLRQEVRMADSALHNQDMPAAGNAVQAAGDLAMRLLQGSPDLSGSLLFQGGGGGGGRREQPLSVSGPELMHSYQGPGHAAQPPPAPVAAPAPAPVETQSKPAPRPEVPGALDRVHFSVSGPPQAAPGSSFVVDVWAHLEQQRQEVIARAQAAALGRPVQIKTKGPLPLARGTVLTVNLKIEDCQIEDPEDTLLWEGEIGSASFAVRVPEGAAPGPRLGRVTIYANAVQVARINFELAVGQGSSEAAALPFREKIHHSAFASYASADRELVLRYIHGMEKAAPFMDIFMDVHSLRSGQNWEQQLWERIPTSDVFFLFWSKNASQSKWVEKEWRCALESKGLEFIDPVPMEPPDLAPPPSELAGLHFNDWELAYQRNNRE